MKLKMMSLAAMAACVAFTSCTNDDEPANNGQSVALQQVNVGINHMSSRAGITATSFAGNESIGVFLFGGDGIDDAVNGRYNVGDNANIVEPLNVKYTRGGDVGNAENPEWWTSQNPIILSSKSGKLYAYYPYAEGQANNDGKVIPVNVAASQGTGISEGTADDVQPDYMYGSVVNNVSNATEHVDIQMNHALAMVTFKFVRNTYPGDGNITRIELRNKVDGTYVKNGAATMHIGTGAITGGTAGSVYCLPNTILTDLTASNAVPHMLVYPNDAIMAADDVILSITMDGKTYEIALPNTLSDTSDTYAWTKGNNYVYTLNMNGYGFGADDEDGKDDIDVTIAPWIEKTASAGDLNKPIN